MITITYHGTKKAAVRRLFNAGFTEHVDTSESGDFGPGSREYYARPDTPLNDHGWPIETANVSRITSGWAACFNEEI